MTKDQFRDKIQILITNMLPALIDKCDQLYSSGAEDVDSYPDDFQLPKMIFIAALQYESTQYTSGRHNEKKIIRNLSRF